MSHPCLCRIHRMSQKVKREFVPVLHAHEYEHGMTNCAMEQGSRMCTGLSPVLSHPMRRSAQNSHISVPSAISRTCPSSLIPADKFGEEDHQTRKASSKKWKKDGKVLFNPRELQMNLQLQL